MKDATLGIERAAVPGAECILLSNAGIFLKTAKSLTNSYGVAIIEDVQPGHYKVCFWLLYLDHINVQIHFVKVCQFFCQDRIVALSRLWPHIFSRSFSFHCMCFQCV